MRRLLPLLLCLSCTSESGGGGGDESGGLVSGLALAKISLNQAVEVPLMSGGQVAPSTAPIVAGRAGLVRVSVQPEPGWQPREVVARLELSTAAGPLPTQELRQAVNGPSFDADLGSTFNFDLAPETLVPDLAYNVSLHEVAGSHGAPSAGAVFPAGAKAALPAQSTGGPLHLVLVPIQYDADGSSRVPELSEAQVALYRDTLKKLYPVGSVEIRIHDPIPYDKPISAGGDGWSEVLQWLLVQRSQDRNMELATANEYYYGLFLPKPSFVQYCSSGPVCVLGLSAALPDASEEFVRGSVGLGFLGQQAADTMAHETGHAHGRLHAPCAPYGYIQNTDPAFPYPEGRIGVWGFDLGGKTLFDPQGAARDFMGYCDPTWVSDYTWSALFERISFVNTSAGSGAGGGGAGEPMWMVSLDAEGRATLGQRIVLREPPRGQVRMVDVLGTDGSTRRRDPARFYPYSHLPGGFLLVSEPKPGDASLRVGGSTVPWGARGNPLPSR